MDLFHEIKNGILKHTKKIRASYGEDEKLIVALGKLLESEE
jgi:hypothetical protein